MKAYRILHKRPEPFRFLSRCSHSQPKTGGCSACHLKEVGASSEEVPDEPYLLISDAVWFSTELVRLFLEECRNLQPGWRLYCDHEGWKELMEPLQDVESGYDIAYVQGEPTFEGTELLAFDWGLTKTEPNVHITMKEATKSLWGGSAVAHHIDHWSHILRVNQLAIANRAQAVQLQWKRAGLWKNS